MEKDTSKKNVFKKKKENLCSSLCDIERFLHDLNKAFKYINIFKHFK